LFLPCPIEQTTRSRQITFCDSLQDFISHALQAPASTAACIQNAILAILAQHKERSEEHTSELQSRFDLVCRLLLEKKKSSTIPTRRAAWARHQRARWSADRWRVRRDFRPRAP